MSRSRQAIVPFTGDRGDISAKIEYAFGVAVFDNAQVRHAYSPGVLKMNFE